MVDKPFDASESLPEQTTEHDGHSADIETSPVQDEAWRQAEIARLQLLEQELQTERDNLFAQASVQGFDVPEDIAERAAALAQQQVAALARRLELEGLPPSAPQA